MSETSRTLTYVGVALLVLTAAILTRPAPPRPDANGLVKDMLNQVEDTQSATELEIVKYDETDSSSSEFKVAKVNNRWVIPSYENYPADADQQMGNAAASVMNLKVLDMISDKSGDHKIYGVVEPKEDLPAESVGVGMRVTMKNAAGEKLVDMVVGKEVKDRPGQRYVRPLEHDAVFVVNFDASKLTTKFEDWIEKDLLKLNPADIAQVRLNEYSLEYRQHPSGRTMVVPEPRSDITVDYAADKSEWKLAELDVFDPVAKENVKVELSEDEQLDQAKLNDMKSALGDLKIVSVEKKPAGIEPDLKATQAFLENEDAQRNLQQRGYFPSEVKKGFVELRSKEGEIVCQMKDGVEYVLRFGQSLLGGQGGNEGETGKEGASKGRNRYLFVMARLDEKAIPKPDLAELPGDDDATEEKPAADDNKSDEPKADEPKSDEPEADKPEAKDAADKQDEANEKKGAEAPAGKAGKAGPAGKQDAAEKTTEESPEKGTKESADKPAADKPTADSPAEDAPAEDAAADGEKKEPSTDPAETAPKQQPKMDKKTLAAFREMVEKENKRKQDEYDGKVKAAKTRVTDLNKRFGDWYFIISDDVYKKIHLGRNDISKKKEAPKGEGTGLDTLKDLEQGFPGIPGHPAVPKK